jgi:hypothetical protein
MPISVTDVLSGADGVGGDGAGLGRIRCCNRAATEAVHTRTEQENYGARNARNHLDKLDFPTGQYLPGRLRPNLQGGDAGFEPASPLRESTALQPVLNAGPEGHPLSNAHCCQGRTTSVGSHIWKD